MESGPFPVLSLDGWRETRDTLAGYSKVLGKIRRALTPPQKHWWHASLRVSATGVTTTPVWADGRMFEVMLDLTAHQCRVTTSDGRQHSLPLQGQSAADFCRELQLALDALVLPVALDQSVCADTTPDLYAADSVKRYWQALSRIDGVFKRFRHGFQEESSPVQLWPHHFDLALLWLSGRLVPGQDPDDPEYADEQMNFGFSTGDEEIADPYFYATAYPMPGAFPRAPLPDGAHWHTVGWTGAILPYAALADANNPEAYLLTFLRTVHQAGAIYMVDA